MSTPSRHWEENAGKRSGCEFCFRSTIASVAIAISLSALAAKWHHRGDDAPKSVGNRRLHLPQVPFILYFVQVFHESKMNLILTPRFFFLSVTRKRATLRCICSVGRRCWRPIRSNLSANCPTSSRLRIIFRSLPLFCGTTQNPAKSCNPVPISPLYNNLWQFEIRLLNVHKHTLIQTLLPSETIILQGNRILELLLLSPLLSLSVVKVQTVYTKNAWQSINKICFNSFSISYLCNVSSMMVGIHLHSFF